MASKTAEEKKIIDIPVAENKREGIISVYRSSYNPLTSDKQQKTPFSSESRLIITAAIDKRSTKIANKPVFLTGHTMEEFFSYDEFKHVPVQERKDFYQKFWINYKFIIDGKGIKLDRSKEMDMLAIKMLEAHPMVAKTNERVNPTFHVAQMIDEMKMGNDAIKRISYQMEAYKKISEMPPHEIYTLARMLKLIDVNTNTTIATARLGTEIEKNPKKFIEYIQSPLFTYRRDLYEMVETGIVVIKNGNYMYENIIVGTNYDKAVNYLVDESNSQIYNEMRIALSNAKKGKQGV